MAEEIPVNHEAWLELEDGMLRVYWGHFPRVDGMLELHAVREACVASTGGCKPILLAKGSGSRGECLEARVVDAFDYILLLYERRIVKAGGSWYSGFDGLYAKAAAGSFEDARLVYGLAKLCKRGGSCPDTGHPLDLTIRGGEVIAVSFGVEASTELRVYARDGSLLSEASGSRVVLPEDAYVIVAKRRVACTSSRLSGYSLVAVLTLA